MRPRNLNMHKIAFLWHAQIEDLKGILSFQRVGIQGSKEINTYFILSTKIALAA